MKKTLFSLCGLVLAGAALAATPDFQSKYLSVSWSRTHPAVETLGVDSLGQGRLKPVSLLTTNLAVCQFSNAVGKIFYQLGGTNLWRGDCSEKEINLRSDYTGFVGPAFVWQLREHTVHPTVLGLMQPGERRVALPCLLHLPDLGTLRITCNQPGIKLDYDADRYVRLDFPAATAAQPHLEYKLEVVAIYPKLPGIENNPLYDSFRRDWLNVFQVNPRRQMLANNSASDICTFTVFEYADLAVHTPPLANGLTANDLVRMTLDRYLAGVKGYGQIGGWKTPWNSLDSLPSVLISACNYVNSSGDWKWAEANYKKLSVWGREMFAADKDGNGLIEYPGTGNFGERPTPERRPANWWDTINFGHEDAFSNALAYEAGKLFAELARRLNKTEDAEFFAARAAKLKAAYAPTFLNPQTGVLAGWKSADGQLHDYWFTYVQGMAITFGLVDDKLANRIMDKLLAKMTEVGFTNFSLGLPGNLVPVKKGDYVDHGDMSPQRFGQPKLDDGSDGFQYYENGGATGCWAYYTVKALIKLGRIEDARRIFHPMLAAYARGEFQGFEPGGGSYDWRDWAGHGHGYEGLLVDNYHALLAVLDDVKASSALTTNLPITKK